MSEGESGEELKGVRRHKSEDGWSQVEGGSGELITEN
jgi:hypothetical protein